MRKKAGQPWTPEQALVTLRRARAFCILHRHYELAEELRFLTEDVSTATQEVRKQTRKLYDELDNVRCEEREASAANVAFAAILGERAEWARLFDTGFAVEYIVPTQPKKRKKAA